MDITNLTVHELQEKLKAKEITISEITKAYVENIEKHEKDVQAFITTLETEAMDKAAKVQEKVEKGEIISSFAGIPIGIKDNICTKGIKTTCASKMLENFVLYLLFVRHLIVVFQIFQVNSNKNNKNYFLLSHPPLFLLILFPLL